MFRRQPGPSSLNAGTGFRQAIHPSLAQQSSVGWRPDLGWQRTRLENGEACRPINVGARTILRPEVCSVVDQQSLSCLVSTFKAVPLGVLGLF